MDIAYLDAVKIFFPATLAFLVGIGITPIFSKYFYKWKMWRKYGRSQSVDGSANQVLTTNDRAEMETPRLGGMIVWVSVYLTIGIIFLIFYIIPTPLTSKLEFLSRNQTFIPIATLLIGALMGLVDDLLQIYPPKMLIGDPIYVRYIKIILISILAFIVGWWLYTKLGIDSIHIPFDGSLYIGSLMIPFFVIITLGVFSTSVVDGVDGLSGGLLATVFAAFTGIAFFHSQIDLAAFCSVVVGAILAFLWFNIPPARFYMGETGMMALTLTLSTIAFLTDSVLLLPIIAFPLFITSLVAIIQMTSRKFFGKKVFRVALLHNYFELIGWSRAKITMRYWIVGLITATIGVVLGVIS